MLEIITPNVNSKVVVSELKRRKWQISVCLGVYTHTPPAGGRNKCDVSGARCGESNTSCLKLCPAQPKVCMMKVRSSGNHATTNGESWRCFFVLCVEKTSVQNCHYVKETRVGFLA